MMDHRYFLDYVNFLTMAGSRAEEVVDVPKDYPDHLRAGIEYSELIALPGYKRLLDDMEKRADTALSALRLCETSDLQIISGLRSRWREAEESLKFIQIRASEAIELRKSIIEDLGLRFGVMEGIDDSADVQKIKQHMTGDRVMDDLISINDDDEQHNNFIGGL